MTNDKALMHVTARTWWAVAACLCLAWSGCAGFGSHPAAQPAAGEVVYEPPVPVDKCPTYEAPTTPPPVGWEKWYPTNWSESFNSAIGQGRDQEIARKLYAEGDDLYRHKKYSDAGAKYAAAAGRWPDSTLEENAMFMAGESYFFADKYSKADDYYGGLTKKYSNSRYMNIVVVREFAIGLYWVQCDYAHPHYSLTPNFFDDTRPMFDTFGYAAKALDQARINDPRGKLADEALMAMGNAYFLRGDYEDADYYYKLIRSDYPKSPHQKEAHLLGIQAKLRKYQGPAYDEKPLKEAEELLDQTLAQFGSELGAERDRLVTTKGEVHAQLAVRNWTVGQYYEKGAHYAAARVYYNDIVKEYPQTQLAQQARTRIDAIAKLPDNPPDYFEFLAVVFDGKNPNPDKDLNLPTAQPIGSAPVSAIATQPASATGPARQ